MQTLPVKQFGPVADKQLHAPIQNKVALPKPEIRGVGSVLYRCASCGGMMPPETAVIANDLSYHPSHAPEMTDGS